VEKLYCINFYADNGVKRWKGYRNREQAKDFVNSLGQRFIRMDIALRPVMA